MLAVTLTSRECAATAELQSVRLNNFWKRLRRAGMKRYLIVVEFNESRLPHYHGVVEGVSRVDVWRAWQAVMGPENVNLGAQDMQSVDGIGGWFGYLRSHLGKGGIASTEGQRSNSRAPESWLSDGSLGRMWRRGGEWPVVEGVRLREAWDERFVLRRRLRSARVSMARTLCEKSMPVYRHRNAKRSLVRARTMLRCGDRALSEVRGATCYDVGPWIARGLDMRVDG